VLHFALEFSEGLIGAQNSCNMEEKVFHLGNVGSILLKVVSDAKV
jgi:hypothetical protein